MKSAKHKIVVNDKICREQLKKMRGRRKRLMHYEAELNIDEKIFLEESEETVLFLKRLQ